MSDMSEQKDIYIESELSYSSIILTFRLYNWQIEMINKAINVKEINSNKIKIYNTDVFTDLLAIPYFIAFINFEDVDDFDRQTFFQYWRECREPLPNDGIEGCLNLGDPKEKFIKMPLTYVLNCEEANIPEGNYLFINRDIFSSKERLRLMILQEIKNIEGKGRQANDKASDKLRRVLYIYNSLIYEGWINKDKIDRWLDIKGHRQISQRTFMRDMEIIRDFDKNIEYNIENKRYELNLKKYFLKNV